MPDLLQGLLDAGAIRATAFPPTSRYAALSIEESGGADEGPGIPYLQRRFCPRPERLSTLSDVAIVEGDRRDVLAARHLGDPELWWRLADANATLNPRELHQPVGRRVVVALAEGVPGAFDE